MKVGGVSGVRARFDDDVSERASMTVRSGSCDAMRCRMPLDVDVSLSILLHKDYFRCIDISIPISI
eukprot:SAG31_NODE_14953_length_778_cov_2.072165_2_plen_66_part_00